MIKYKSTSLRRIKTVNFIKYVLIGNVIGLLSIGLVWGTFFISLSYYYFDFSIALEHLDFSKAPDIYHRVSLFVFELVIFIYIALELGADNISLDSNK